MLNIVFNPTAAKGKSVKKLKIIENKLNELKIQYKIHESKKEKHCIEITQNLIKSGESEIVAMGGDGTVNEVLNGITDFERVNLGIIPSGSGNDFVKSINIPSKPLEALDIILNKRTKYTDFMQLDGVRGLNIVGTGIDVDVLKRCKSSNIFRGKLQYLISLIISLIKFKDYRLKIKYNDKKEERKALIACVCNGNIFGGGINICPTALPDDGYLDYMVAFDVKKSKIPNAFIKLMKGKILNEPIAYTEKTKEIEISSESNMTINVDGELFENIPLNVKLVHNKLKIYRP